MRLGEAVSLKLILFKLCKKWNKKKKFILKEEGEGAMLYPIMKNKRRS